MSSGFAQVHITPTNVPSYADTTAFPVAAVAGRLAYSIADANIYLDNGSSWNAAFVGTGEVVASIVFANDNRLIRSDGAVRGVQASTVALTDAGALSGITDIALTGTVDGRDVSVDGAVLDTAILDADFGSSGVMTRTGAGTYTSRTVTGTANQVTVTNGDGVAGNPTLALPQSIHTAATPTFASLTLTNKLFTSALNTATASDAGTTTIGAAVLIQLLSPDAAAVPAHTVTLPATPANGQLIFLANAHATNTVVALTVNAPGGATVVGGPTALAVGTNACFVYVTATTTWVRVS